jgi:hypothetical protein
MVKFRQAGVEEEMMAKVIKSIAAERKALLCDVSKRYGDELIDKTIPFRNDDIPKFLQELDKFEKRSRKTRIVVK